LLSLHLPHLLLADNPLLFVDDDLRERRRSAKGLAREMGVAILEKQLPGAVQGFNVKRESP
jgi:hypothetical protein